MITPIYSPAPGRYENGMKYRLRQLAINGTLRIRQGYHPF